MQKKETNTSQLSVRDKEITKKQVFNVILGEKMSYDMSLKEAGQGWLKEECSVLKVQKYLRS